MPEIKIQPIKETNGVFPKEMEDILLWCGTNGVFTQVEKTCSKLDRSRKDLRQMGLAIFSAKHSC